MQYLYAEHKSLVRIEQRLQVGASLTGPGGQRRARRMAANHANHARATSDIADYIVSLYNNVLLLYSALHTRQLATQYFRAEIGNQSP